MSLRVKGLVVRQDVHPRASDMRARMQQLLGYILAIADSPELDLRLIAIRSNMELNTSRTLTATRARRINKNGEVARITFHTGQGSPLL